MPTKPKPHTCPRCAELTIENHRLREQLAIDDTKLFEIAQAAAREAQCTDEMVHPKFPPAETIIVPGDGYAYHVDKEMAINPSIPKAKNESRHPGKANNF